MTSGDSRKLPNDVPLRRVFAYIEVRKLHFNQALVDLDFVGGLLLTPKLSGNIPEQSWTKWTSDAELEVISYTYLRTQPLWWLSKRP